MVLEAKSKVYAHPGGRHSQIIYIPADIAKDSAYPFRAGDEVVIRIDPEKKALIVYRAYNGNP